MGRRAEESNLSGAVGENRTLISRMGLWCLADRRQLQNGFAARRRPVIALRLKRQLRCSSNSCSVVLPSGPSRHLPSCRTANALTFVRVGATRETRTHVSGVALPCPSSWTIVASDAAPTARARAQRARRRTPKLEGGPTVWLCRTWGEGCISPPA